MNTKVVTLKHSKMNLSDEDQVIINDVKNFLLPNKAPIDFVNRSQLVKKTYDIPIFIDIQDLAADHGYELREVTLTKIAPDYNPTKPNFKHYQLVRFGDEVRGEVILDEKLGVKEIYAPSDLLLKDLDRNISYTRTFDLYEKEPALDKAFVEFIRKIPPRELAPYHKDLILTQALFENKFSNRLSKTKTNQVLATEYHNRAEFIYYQVGIINFSEQLNTEKIYRDEMPSFNFRKSGYQEEFYKRLEKSGFSDLQGIDDGLDFNEDRKISQQELNRGATTDGSRIREAFMAKELNEIDSNNKFVLTKIGEAHIGVARQLMNNQDYTVIPIYYKNYKGGRSEYEKEITLIYNDLKILEGVEGEPKNSIDNAMENYDDFYETEIALTYYYHTNPLSVERIKDTQQGFNQSFSISLSDWIYASYQKHKSDFESQINTDVKKVRGRN